MIATRMSDLAFAVVLGTALGVGVCLLISLAPRWGAPSLARRIAPYIRDVTDPRGLDVVAPGGSPFDWSAFAHGRLARLAGGDAVLMRRLHRAAWTIDAARFRSRQLGWAIVGLGVGGGVAVVLVLAGRGSPVLGLVPPVAAVAAALAYDAWLTHAAQARAARIEEELPTVLEFLALCLSAGEGILDSLRRVSEVGAGELTSELRGVVIAVGTGSPLSEALTRLAAGLEIPALTRAIDQLVAAIERGAPLAHVLQAQALDAREDAKRALIERAGRKEIYMLLPARPACV
ncbi:type II secretion system F family protein [Microbacterium sp. QXD-8]|uniref:Type II secretion system F family protein n=1 Tax=Microbacterium psychrotolerans TaxID=3068321 RepID=A0ABU0YY88_9MICO|nr:type II secretion system F family protein [Microbacterium sp. QXD-8]MDQ7877295.1 type II secretion system F family protein [Microbacterium sp. QXD-8]